MGMDKGTWKIKIEHNNTSAKKVNRRHQIVKSGLKKTENISLVEVSYKILCPLVSPS